MSSLAKRVLLTTFVAGTLDILSAYVYVFIKTGHVSKKMFQYIASGALGSESAMNGGLAVILLGIFIHYFIAFTFTLFFFLIYPKLPFLSFNKYITGIIYGVFTWCIMNLVVLPLSMMPPIPFNLQNAIINILILMVMIGLPISISAHDYYKKKV